MASKTSSTSTSSRKSSSSSTRETTVAPIRIDNQNRRSGEHPLEGHFVRVINGEHEGQIGVFESVADTDKDGYPSLILVHFRDYAYEHAYATPKLDDVRPADPYKGGR